MADQNMTRDIFLREAKQNHASTKSASLAVVGVQVALVSGGRGDSEDGVPWIEVSKGVN